MIKCSCWYVNDGFAVWQFSNLGNSLMMFPATAIAGCCKSLLFTSGWNSWHAKMSDYRNDSNISLKSKNRICVCYPYISCYVSEIKYRNLYNESLFWCNYCELSRVITKRPNSPNINMSFSVVYFCYDSRTNKRQTYTSTINVHVRTEKRTAVQCCWWNDKMDKIITNHDTDQRFWMDANSVGDGLCG